MKKVTALLFTAVLVLPLAVVLADDTQNVNGNIRVSGAVAVNSDGRLTQNIAPLSSTLSKLDQLRGVSFEWNHLSATSMRHKEGEKGIGMIAQELQKVYPELVAGSKKDYLAINYGAFTAVLLQSVKELNEKVISLFKGLSDRVQALEARMDKVNILERQVKDLKSENKEIKERVEKLEKATGK